MLSRSRKSSADVSNHVGLIEHVCWPHETHSIAVTARLLWNISQS